MNKINIIDFDNTLFMTRRHIYNAYEKAFSENGFIMSSGDFKRIWDNGIFSNEMIEKWGNNRLLKIRETKDKIYYSWFDKIEKNDSLFSIINNSNALNIICSMGSLITIENILNYWGYRKLFNVIVGRGSNSSSKEEMLKHIFGVYCDRISTLCMYDDSISNLELAFKLIPNHIDFNAYIVDGETIDNVSWISRVQRI